MYEINVAALETDSRDFPLARRAVLGRYNHLYEEHTPGGRLTRGRDAPQRECVAGSYTAIVMSHTQTAAGAFNSGLYAAGFALVRPMLEALLKQAMLGEYKGDDDGWKKIPDRRINVTRPQLEELGSRSGCSDILPLWENLMYVTRSHSLAPTRSVRERSRVWHRRFGRPAMAKALAVRTASKCSTWSMRSAMLTTLPTRNMFF